MICIVGPTASGKSRLAMHLCEMFSGEIVNADSRQFYREMNIGTAKPTENDLIRVRHHLIDCASIEDPWNIARFVREFEIAVQDIRARGKLPVLVGGTGLYVRSALFGVDEIPQITTDVMSSIEQMKSQIGLAGLYAKLRQLDEVGAARLKPNDSQRIERALAVVMQTGKPIHSFWNEGKPSKYRFLKLAPSIDREQLYQRIDARVLEMVQAGLKSEVEQLSLMHPDNDVVTKTIGYREWLETDFDDSRAVVLIQKNTRNFAKRQITWFGNESDVTWLDFSKYEDLCIQRVRDFLNT